MRTKLSAFSSQPAATAVGCPIHSASFSGMGGRAQTPIARIVSYAGIAALLLIAGCRQDMQNQPKLIPQRGSEMFADHRGARPQVVNTVARGQLHEDSYFYTGVIQGANGYREEQNLMPFPVTMEVLKRGQERFNVYCTPCHSRVGNGLGEIVDRGYKPAANLHDQVRMAQPLSHYFYVMTHGYGAMPDYSAQLTPEDRWAVAAYIRALQLSQAATAADVPSGAQVKDLKDIAEEKHLPAGICRAVDASADSGSGLSASDQRRISGDGSSAIRRTRRSRFQQPNRPLRPRSLNRPHRPRSRDLGRIGMANEQHVHAHAKQLPKRSGRPGLCRRLDDAGACHRSGVCRHRRGPRTSADGSIEHVLRAWLLGTVLTFGWAVGGLALLMVQYVQRRQVGLAACAGRSKP